MRKPADPGLTIFDPEEETDEQEQERRHNSLVLFFLFTLDETQSAIRQLTDDLATGVLSHTAWADEFRKELQARHSEAASIGRRLAGSMAPFGDADLKAGVEAWARQEEYFTKFVQDLESGRYDVKKGDENADAEVGELNEKAFNARAKMYGQGIRNSATESFRVEMGDDPLRWVLGDKEHCRQQPDFAYNCPDLSEEEPNPASEWPTSPGGMMTPCGIWCDCGFESVDRRYSTEGI